MGCPGQADEAVADSFAEGTQRPQQRSIMRAEVSSTARAHVVPGARGPQQQQAAFLDEQGGAQEDVGGSGDPPTEEEATHPRKNGKGRLARRVWQQLQESQEVQHHGHKAQRSQQDESKLSDNNFPPSRNAAPWPPAAARVENQLLGQLPASPAALATSASSSHHDSGGGRAGEDATVKRTRVGTDVYRRKVKNRLEGLEKSELASQTTYYRLLQRLERVEKRQEEMQQEEAKVFRNLDALVLEDLEKKRQHHHGAESA